MTNAEPDPYGFSKAARNRAAEAAEQAKIPTSLNPEFPYTMVPFDPVFFNFTANPEGVRGS